MRKLNTLQIIALTNAGNLLALQAAHISVLLALPSLIFSSFSRLLLPPLSWSVSWSASVLLRPSPFRLLFIWFYFVVSSYLHWNLFFVFCQVSILFPFAVSSYPYSAVFFLPSRSSHFYLGQFLFLVSLLVLYFLMCSLLPTRLFFLLSPYSACLSYTFRHHWTTQISVDSIKIRTAARSPRPCVPAWYTLYLWYGLCLTSVTKGCNICQNRINVSATSCRIYLDEQTVCSILYSCTTRTHADRSWRVESMLVSLHSYCLPVTDSWAAIFAARLALPLRSYDRLR